MNCGSDKTPRIHEMVHLLGRSTRPLLPTDPIPSDLAGLIISGAPILLTEQDLDPVRTRFDYLKTIIVPVLGICYGHQVLGLLHGAQVSRCPEDRADQQIQLHSSSTLFEGIENPATFAEDHCECIDLPTQFVKTASSATCDIEGIQHPYKDLFGVQFHPEVSGENGQQLIRNFCALCQ